MKPPFLVAFLTLIFASVLTSACDNDQAPAPDASETSQPAASDAATDTGQAEESSSEVATEMPANTLVPSEIDYSDEATWLCKPGRDDACAVNLDTTVIAGDGTMTLEAFARAEDPAFDCFYVYPTVSNDPGGNSDMVANTEELSVIRAQFARYGQHCRTFAPLYRQITLTALRARITNQPISISPNMGYSDVLAAWTWYLENENDGRGVVLVGHSQGSGMLTRLISEEIDGKPIQKQIIAAHLIGTRLPVPPGETVGGAFQSMPLCTSAEEAGCVITFASFRDTVPPPADTRFGRVPDEGMIAACTNPASLGGGSGELHNYLSTGINELVSSARKPTAWTDDGEPVTTPFVSLPGFLSSACVDDGTTSYLSVTVHGNPDDPRTDDMVGDVVVGGEVQANWGLHLVDMHIAMGNLLDLAQKEYETWAAVSTAEDEAAE